MTIHFSHSLYIDKNSIHPKPLLHSQIEKELELTHIEHTFENREIGKIHNPYDQEIREFTSIERGDLETLEKSLSENYPGEIGKLARTPLRHMKNRGIVVITLACRAAIRGGILPEEAFSLSDSYIQKIEDCNDISAIQHLFHAAEYRYAQMVHAHLEKNMNKNTTNAHIENCKTYIFSHLHEKIQVHKIAQKMNLNPNYLSELFRKHEDMTITEYIHQKKVDLAKNLLVYSTYTYSEIATYLGYSSQSHLGRQFKRYTGMTMCQYQNQYGQNSL